ncbi:MAG: response regulator [Balneolaceae bacterium]
MLSKITICDDDRDDVYLFKEAASEMNLPASITVISDGKMLLKQLTRCEDDNLPQIVFIDLHLHGKTCAECVSEIMGSDELKDLPVVILSTNYNQKTADYFYEKGACYFIKKPTSFNTLKKRIQKAINLISKNSSQPPKEEFYLT